MPRLGGTETFYITKDGEEPAEIDTRPPTTAEWLEYTRRWNVATASEDHGTLLAELYVEFGRKVVVETRGWDVVPDGMSPLDAMADNGCTASLLAQIGQHYFYQSGGYKLDLGKSVAPSRRISQTESAASSEAGKPTPPTPQDQSAQPAPS